MQFDDLIAEIEAEARAEGPEAVAELEAFRAHFSRARVVERMASGDIRSVERLLSGIEDPGAS